MTNLKKDISIILPNYNGRSLLEKYLPFVYLALQQSAVVGSYEIIVVDDASTDDSVEFIESVYPQIRLLRNYKNSGFSITINRGIFAAEKELVLLLNTDMKIPQDFFDKLIPFFDRDDTFGVFSAIKNEDGTRNLEAQKWPKIKNSSLSFFDREIENGFSLYLCGGNSLIDRKKIQIIGGFDTIFSPFYYEDFDLGLRAWQKGWKLYYCGETSCMHCHSKTVKIFSQEYVSQISHRNYLIFNYLNTEGLRHVFFGINIVFRYLFAISGHHAIYKKSIPLFLDLHKDLVKKRRERKKGVDFSVNQILKRYFL